ncbi:MAG TPA: hypothetical protein VMU84_16690 [Thermoanaerobaculia bacterium]|nr:hypothetical protein [Thermoanaerobaculia bacterium]
MPETMRAWHLRIAEIAMVVRCDDDAIDVQFEGPVEKFFVGAGDPEIELAVRSGQLAVDPGSSSADCPLPAAHCLFDSGSVWRMFAEDHGYRIECRSEAIGDAPYKVAHFNEAFTRGTIVIDTDAVGTRINPLEYPLDEVLLANLLGRGRGVELHSCGIIDHEGRGHLFVGQSGAGKTTTARLWEGAARDIVSDDRVIVRAKDGAMWMYGTPWHGEAELSSPVGVPLSGVYLLEQANANELRDLEPGAAVARLFACTFPMFHDPGALAFTLDMLRDITMAVPVRELRFTRERSVVELIRTAA